MIDSIKGILKMKQNSDHNVTLIREFGDLVDKSGTSLLNRMRLQKPYQKSEKTHCCQK